ncbi:hypothetical protein VNO77_03007 [Canavalia gladiata]|uniref:Uncharacterized protein n=1 Tax=Canavalia gladiata TaxID=3824 RepID=A0AAN9MU04_CANGL
MQILVYNWQHMEGPYMMLRPTKRASIGSLSRTILRSCMHEELCNMCGSRLWTKGLGSGGMHPWSSGWCVVAAPGTRVRIPHAMICFKNTQSVLSGPLARMGLASTGRCYGVDGHGSLIRYWVGGSETGPIFLPQSAHDNWAINPKGCGLGPAPPQLYPCSNWVS